MKSGIYMIKCKETGKVYIGHSVNMKTRFQVHMSDLKRGKHGNPYFKNMYHKYGKSVFEFSVIEYCQKENLIDREYFWIDYYDSTNRSKGFNIIYDKIREKEKKASNNTIDYRKKKSEEGKKRWEDPEYAKMNKIAIQKAHEERRAKGLPLACLLPDAIAKSKAACRTPEFRKKVSENSKKQMKDPKQKEALKNNFFKYCQLRRSEKIKEQEKNCKIKKTLSQINNERWADPGYRKNMSEKVSTIIKKKWNDPIYREMMSKSAKKRWARESERVAQSQKRKEYFKAKRGS